jgi:hypothetical protein
MNNSGNVAQASITASRCGQRGKQAFEEIAGRKVAAEGFVSVLPLEPLNP